MLTVGISTSSGQFALVIGENKKVLFDSSDYSDNDRELDDALSLGLASCKKEVTEIAHIMVDVGPGGTSRVRTGIAFANSLAYSLGISVSPVSSIELAGIDAWSRYGLPVVHSVKSIKENAYIGLYHHHVVSMKYGAIPDIVPGLVKEMETFVVTGFHRETILNMPSLKSKVIIDSAIFYGNAKILIEQGDLFTLEKCGFPLYVQPITEKTL